jgi:hypothetical protein
MKRLEWVSSKLPWLEPVLFFVFGAICSLSLFWIITGPKPASPAAVETKPAIYILQEFDYNSMEGATTFILDYTKDGEVQAEALFPDKDQRAAFKRYLDEKYGIVNKK